jgi:hypothetical protein
VREHSFKDCCQPLWASLDEENVEPRDILFLRGGIDGRPLDPNHGDMINI